ncbi:hypothetical protein SESBI_20770 [Sesbania bispinosa]|nr:hypothetical protein SESBI_20770 [Sesbania bispinosa]
MANNGKNIALPKENTWRRYSVRIRNRTIQHTKRQRVTEELEISSSLSQKNESKFDKGNPSSHRLNQQGDQMHDEVTLNEVREIKRAVNSLTMMMVNYIPIHGTTGTKIGIQASKDNVGRSIEAKIAAFIFSSDDVDHLPGNELLITSSWVRGDRATLKTFMPTKHLHGKVIDMVVCRLTYNEQLLTSDSINWFLPTMFAKYALDTQTEPEIVIKLFKGQFMSQVELVHKALFIQEMLMDSSFYEISNAEKPEVAGFTLVEPSRIAQELPGS